MWDERDRIGKDLIGAGSLFLGLDSPIGSLYMGAGKAEGDNQSLFLFLGRTF